MYVVGIVEIARCVRLLAIVLAVVNCHHHLVIRESLQPVPRFYRMQNMPV